MKMCICNQIDGDGGLRLCCLAVAMADREQRKTISNVFVH